MAYVERCLLLYFSKLCPCSPPRLASLLGSCRAIPLLDHSVFVSFGRRFAACLPRHGCIARARPDFLSELICLRHGTRVVSTVVAKVQHLAQRSPLTVLQLTYNR